MRRSAEIPFVRRMRKSVLCAAGKASFAGRVQNVVDFGAFIDIGLKTSGLVHKSELSAKHFRHPLDVVAVGDIVEAEIISIDEQRNRIGLSLKRAAARNKN